MELVEWLAQMGRPELRDRSTTSNTILSTLGIWCHEIEVSAGPSKNFSHVSSLIPTRPTWHRFVSKWNVFVVWAIYISKMWDLLVSSQFL